MEYKGLQPVEFDLSRYHKKHRPPTELWAKAEEISKITGDSPNRWLRYIKSNPVAIQRALDTLKEMSPHNKAAYFIWLFKKFKASNS